MDPTNIEKTFTATATTLYVQARLVGRYEFLFPYPAQCSGNLKWPWSQHATLAKSNEEINNLLQFCSTVKVDAITEEFVFRCKVGFLITHLLHSYTWDTKDISAIPEAENGQ